MGFFASALKTKFLLKKIDIDNASKSLLKFAPWMHDLYHVDGLLDAFELMGFGYDFNNDGDITSLYPMDKVPDDLDQYLSSIAHYVEPLSYIDMIDDSDELWRYVFYDDQCSRYPVEIVCAQYDELVEHGGQNAET